MLKRNTVESPNQGPGKSGTAKPPVRPAVPDRAKSLEMAARIYRASIGAFARPVEEIQSSDDFRKFIAMTGVAVAPLTPLFDIEHYLAKVAGPMRGSMNPVLHFCTYGPFTGFAPTWLFDEPYVRQSIANLSAPAGRRGKANMALPADPLRSDVVELFVAILENAAPPYIHPHPLFDPDLWASTAGPPLTVHPAVDFVTTRNVGRRCFSPYFSVPCYGHTRPHIRAGNINPLFLYLTNCAAGKVDDVNPMFHSLYVKHTHKLPATDVLSYYLTEGLELGVPPNPFADEELRISDADRLSGDLSRLYLDYLRCEADLEASLDLKGAPLFGKGAAAVREAKGPSFRMARGYVAPEIAAETMPSRAPPTPAPFTGPEETFPIEREAPEPVPEIEITAVSATEEIAVEAELEIQKPASAEAESAPAETEPSPAPPEAAEVAITAEKTGEEQQPEEASHAAEPPPQVPPGEEHDEQPADPADRNSPSEEEAII